MKQLLFSLTIATLILTGTGCMTNGQFGIRGEGPVVDRKLNLSTIKGISVPSSAKVFITQGTVQEVKVSGQENILEILNTDVQGEVWKIDFKRPVWMSEPITVYITMESLRMLKISGSGDVVSTSRLNDLKDVELQISGSGKIKLDMEARDVNATISGSGDLFLSGTADDLNFSISGSGGIHADELLAKKAEARISGSGGMELALEDRLDARISGSGNIRYKGNPKVDASVSGSGTVRSR